jgi:hypothetical protein
MWQVMLGEKSLEIPWRKDHCIDGNVSGCERRVGIENGSGEAR